MVPFSNELNLVNSLRSCVHPLKPPTENGRLKRIVADLTLDNAMLKEVAKGNFGSPAVQVGSCGR